MCKAGAGYGASGCCSFGCHLGQLGLQLPPLDSCTLAWLSAVVGWQLHQNQGYILLLLNYSAIFSGSTMETGKDLICKTFFIFFQ